MVEQRVRALASGVKGRGFDPLSGWKICSGSERAPLALLAGYCQYSTTDLGVKWRALVQ